MDTRVSPQGGLSLLIDENRTAIVICDRQARVLGSACIDLGDHGHAELLELALEFSDFREFFNEFGSVAPTPLGVEDAVLEWACV